MEALVLARWQFAITSVYHFLFVPLTLGLSILLAVMETQYVRTDNQLYKRMAKFWGKLFLINFAMGVVTGIVQEFHFGMNWSEYSRFMGDIFGAPLAMEALTAFFLESTFLGLWIFGWDRLSKKVHAACIWVVAFASNLSAFWILVANSFMQAPVGYAVHSGRAEMVDFGALITNPYVFKQYPHTLLSGLATAGIFLMAISAYHLLKKTHIEFFKLSLKLGLVCALGASLLVGATGHLQAKFIASAQPMKLAASEALWETSQAAPFSLVASIDQTAQKNTGAISIPGALTFLVYDSFQGEVKGLKDLQAEYSQKYGPGNYIPEVSLVFWTFRAMVASGIWMILLSLLCAWLWYTGKIENATLVLKAVLWSIPIPYIANSTGWIVAEAGRQPWIVFGLQKVDQAVSPTVGAASIMFSMAGFTLIYGVLAVAAVYLACKCIARGPVEDISMPKSTVKGATLWN
jgi:cytochrome d ubiquinol oxidase subunit I